MKKPAPIQTRCAELVDHHAYETTFCAGTRVRIDLTIPPPGQVSRFTAWFSRPLHGFEEDEYRRFKRLIEADLKNISGRPHFFGLEQSAQIQRRRK
jgi:hypothetical protein